MNTNIFKKIFIIFAFLVIADIVCLLAIEEFRNALGVFDEQSRQQYIIRLLPDFIMLSFYLTVIVRLQRGKSIPSVLLKLHCILFALLGLVLCMPWAGMFFAPLVPIGVLYLGAILWLPEGFYIAMSVAIMFFSINIYLFTRETRGHPLK